MLDARVAVHFVCQRVEIPGFAASLAIMLPTQIEDLIFECFIAVPTVSGEDAAVFHDDPVLAFVDPKERDVVRTIT